MEGAIVTEAEINYGLCPPLDEGCTCYLQKVQNERPNDSRLFRLCDATERSK